MSKASVVLCDIQGLDPYSFMLGLCPYIKSIPIPHILTSVGLFVWTQCEEIYKPFRSSVGHGLNLNESGLFLEAGSKGFHGLPEVTNQSSFWLKQS